MKFHGDQRHTRAVRRLLSEEVEAGRITCTATVVCFNDRNGLVTVELALDRMWPEWRADPLGYLQNFRLPKEVRLFLQIRTGLCRQMNLNPAEARRSPSVTQ